MKNFISIITILLLFGSTALAQENLMKFTDSIFIDSVNVAYTVEGDGKYDSWISLNERETLSLQVGINDLSEIRSFLEDSYSKYLEWAEVAEENEVKELLRDIDAIRVGKGLAFYYSEWYFAFNESQIRTSIIISEGQPSFAFVVPSRESSSNEYIESDTAVLLFDNKSDFDSFLAVFDSDEAKARVDEFNRIQSLFD